MHIMSSHTPGDAAAPQSKVFHHSMLTALLNNSHVTAYAGHEVADCCHDMKAVYSNADMTHCS